MTDKPAWPSEGWPVNRREARRWVREHWQAFMRNADVPGLLDAPQKVDELIADIFTEESCRLADRLEPRSRP